MNRALLAFVIALATGCTTPTTQAPALPDTQAEAVGPFMGMQPTDTPKLLLPNNLANNLEAYNGTFSPKGDVFFYTVQTPGPGFICFSELQANNSWSAPRVAPFSGIWSEYDPIFAPNGSLYFTSERPWNDAANTTNRTAIWKVQQADSGWTAPKRIPLSGQGDYHSSVSTTGNIYFNVWFTGDLYRATPTDTGFAVQPLPPILNAGNGIGDPFIAPDESYLIYRGYQNSLGNGDLYISFQSDTGWTAPINLGAPINSPAHEMTPCVTPDGRFFVFASSRITEPYAASPNATINALVEKHRSNDNGNLNIWYLSADFIHTLRPTH